MKVFIIDDDKILHNSILRVFNEAHEFESRYDIDSALSFISTHSVLDLVFLDLRLNGKDRNGFIVYDAIRKIWGNDIPIVIITGCDDEMLTAAEHKVLEDNKLSLCRKPFTINDLECIFNALDPNPNKS